MDSKHQKTNLWKSATIAVGLLLVGLIVAGVWYNQNHYTAQYDGNFLSSCEAQGASADACGCTLGVVKANYSFKQAKALDTGAIPQDLSDKINTQCVN